MHDPLYPVGTIVQRRDGTRGPPPYRFRGIVCGLYTNPETYTHGCVVSSLAEPGCIQVFPVGGLEFVATNLMDYLREQASAT